MTSITAPPAPASGGAGPAHAVVAFTSSLAGALDRLAEVPTWTMSPDEQRSVLVGLRRQRARLAELELRVLVAADRNQVGAESGATSTPAWLAHATASTRAACFRDLHLAEKLDTGFEATRRALAAGVITVEKARIITAAVAALTDEHDDLPAGTRERAEAHLVDLATRFDPPALRQAGKRVFEVVCPEAADQVEGARLAREEAAARRLAYLSIRDTGDGTSEGRFRLPTLHAHLLRKALQALTSPRRIGEKRLDPETGRKLPASTLLGQGLMQLLENHLSDLPSTNGSPFTLVVTLGVDALMTGIGVAVTETGHRISAGEARRLAAKAGIIPLVLGGDSMPLDVGRQRRLFDRYQKLAINHAYGNTGCAAHNCDRPPAWVEYHHEHPWRHGGATDLRNAIPLCPPHHHMADHPEHYDLRRLPDGRVRFTRRQ